MLNNFCFGYLGEITNPAEKPVGYSGCTPAAPGNLLGGAILNRNAHKLCGTFYDGGQFIGRIVVQTKGDTEPGTQWSG